MDSVKVTAPGPDDMGGSEIDGEREQALHVLNIITRVLAYDAQSHIWQRALRKGRERSSLIWVVELCRCEILHFYCVQVSVYTHSSF